MSFFRAYAERPGAAERIRAACPSILLSLWDRIHSSPIAYRYSYGAFWSLIGGVISRVLGLAASVLVARMLDREVFGELGIIQSTIGLFGAFAGFGLGTTAAKFVAEYRLIDKIKAGRILALSWLAAWATGGLVASSLFITAPWLSKHALAAPDLTPLLRIAAILLCISSVHGAQTGALTGFEAFREIARVSLITGAASFPIMVAGAYFGGIEGVVWGMVLSRLVSCVASHLAILNESRRAGVRTAFEGCLGEWKVLWSFSLPATISGVLVGPVNWVCNAMLVNRENGYAEMGIFNAANQWFGALMFLPGILGQALFPMLSERLGQKDHARAGKILWTAMRLNFVTVFPFILIGGFASHLIMGLYGRSFAHGWATLVVVLLTAAVYAIEAPVGDVIAASGQMWTGCAMNAGWAMAFVGMSFALVSWGALGLAAGRFIAYLLHAIWTFGFAYILIKRIKSTSDVTHAESHF